MLAAVEDWTIRDHEEKMRIWHSYLDTISKRVSEINGIETYVREPDGLNNRSPVLVISWNPGQFNINGSDLAEELATTKPRIAVHSGFFDSEDSTSIFINAGQMQPGNNIIVADRIFEILSKKREKTGQMAPPSGNLTGRWNVDIEYYFSKTRHTFILEQDGNWLQGSHRTDYSLREIGGTFDGDKVKLFSTENMIADNVPFTFSGTLAGDTISGEIYLGEYIRASFIAKRNGYIGPRRQIKFPKGQPLAT
jgi:D-glucosaminate-6-phosphate ammonia-lyase